METEVVIPVPAVDFNFDSACSSPYISAPSTPKRFGEFYFSAPTSPSRASTFYRHFNNLSLINVANNSSSVIPFDWEEKPGKPKSADTHNNDDDFEFGFTGQFERASLSAEELFDSGIIRPLNPSPGLQLGSGLDESETRTSSVSSPLNSERSGTRSLSPFKISEFAWEEQKQQNTKPPALNSKPSSFSASTSSSSSFKGSKKWRLKNFLLFRSASEGRAADKDPLRKYTVLSKKKEEVKNESFPSIDSSGSVSRSRGRGPVSAHELHYTVNRAVSEKLKKKTFLPYKQGLLGCLGFNPAVHGLAKGIGSLTRG